MTDLDGTVVGGPSGDAGLQRWKEWWEAQVKAEPRAMLVYNTARCIRDYRRLREKTAAAGFELPQPNILISGDGCEVRWNWEGDLKLDPIWDQRVRSAWRDSGLERDVRALMEPADRKLIDDLNIVENSPHVGGEYRFAVTVESAETADALVALLRERFGPRVNAYRIPLDGNWGAPNGQEEKKQPYLVSCLPGCTHKGKAAQYVGKLLGRMRRRSPGGGKHDGAVEAGAGAWGGEADEEGEWDGTVVAAGDTVGDEPLLRMGVNFVAVGNSSEDLRAAAELGPKRHYVASAPNAFGVIEGVTHFKAAAAIAAVVAAQHQN